MTKIFIVMTATLLICAGALAQDAPSGDAGPRILMYQSSAAAPVGAVAGGGMFFSAELPPGNGKVITGAPYTATASTEMTQVLGDGNRIVNKTTASLARDSQGRTRREETMGMVGPWQMNGPKLVFINDPTSRKTNYVLDPGRQIVSAIKNPGNWFDASASAAASTRNERQHHDSIGRQRHISSRRVSAGEISLRM